MGLPVPGQSLPLQRRPGLFGVVVIAADPLDHLEDALGQLWNLRLALTVLVL